MTETEQLAWSSFMPSLLACIGATKGPVLELGIGHFSTPALHAYCESANRELYSIEQSKEWYLKFSAMLSSGSPSKHTYFGVENYSKTLPEFAKLKKRWAVVFIDHSPGGENRASALKLFLPVSDYVIVHDYHRDNEEAIGPMLKNVPFTHVTRTYEPPTLVASMTKPIPKSILCL